MNPRITILTGPRRNVSLPITKPEFVIGREESADASITDPPLSRRHCRITATDFGYGIEDCRSVNGTFVNGERIKDRRALQHGDRIGLGNTEVVFLTGPDLDAAEEPPVFLDASPASVGETVDPTAGNLLLTALLGFQSRLGGAVDSRAIREELLSFVLKVTPAGRAAILLMDTEGLRFQVLAGRDRREPSRSVRVSSTIAERIYKDGGALLSNDLAASGLDGIESLKAANVVSLVCVPIEAFGRRAGVIYADASDPAVQFDETQVGLLTAAGTGAAMAFQHVARIEVLERENSRLNEDLGIRHGLVGAGAPMKDLFEIIARTAPSASTVLIQGESGTGKEEVARAIHRNSERRNGPFVSVNCAAIPETLVESELSATKRGRLRERWRRKKGSLSWRVEARCCWMKSARCRSSFSRSCCACCSRGRSSGSAARVRSSSMCGSSPPRIVT